MRLRVQTIKALDVLAAETSAGLRFTSIRRRHCNRSPRNLKAKGKGRVSFVVLGEGGREIEVELAEKFQINPRIKSLLKSVPGVLEVEEV